MPVSDKYKCILLHVPKTGGSSIEKLISPITFFNPKYSPNEKYTPQHLTYSELRAKLPDEKWQTYFKFAFVRNPWDKSCFRLFLG